MDHQIQSLTKKIITLSGSTKFKDDFIKMDKQLTMQNNIVISVGLFGHADNIPLSLEEKQMLDDIHRRKIDLSDGIVVINPGQYIGESTQREIEYTKSKGKFVLYQEPLQEQ